MNRVALALVVACLLLVAGWIGQDNTANAYGSLTWPVTTSPDVISWFDHDSPGQRTSPYLPFKRYDGYQDGSTNALCIDEFTCYCTDGLNCYNGHLGVDVSTGGLEGQPIIAAAPGVVTGTPGNAGDGFGKKVRLWHQSSGIATIYAHMDSWVVAQNQFVNRGQVVGYSGCTGDCTGPHLHFGVYNAQTGGNAIDPYGWSGGGGDPWPYDIGYLWAANPPSNPCLPSGPWSSWENLSGTLTSGVAALAQGCQRLDAFVRAADSTVGHRWFDGAAWSGWENLGGTLASGATPAAVSWGPNRLDVFARSSDSTVGHRWFDGSTWSGWENLGGLTASDPAVISWGPNRFDIFVRSSVDNTVGHRWFDGSTWSGWENLGGPVIGNPAPVSWGPNRLDFFVRGSDNGVWHRWFTGSTWSGWGES